MKHLIKIWILVVVVVAIGLQAKAQITGNELNAEIKKQVYAGNETLVYPRSVLRYYTQSDFQSTWIKPQNGMGPTWQAMLVLDCVMAFGLSHDDYHPKQITYSLLHDILDTPGKVDLRTQATFEITLTDALITLMNHLHYGKLNPEYPAGKIDNGIGLKFKADAYMAEMISKKNLITAIADVQPKMKLYVDLQRRMQLLKGKYQDDCYEVPESEVRKIAINMERLRWAGIEGDNYILINIPTYTLTFQRPDTAYQFKVIVGRPDNPTPTLHSAISHFTTGPEWKVPAKIFARELLPKAMADTAFFENNHYAVYDKKGKYISTNKEAVAQIKKNPASYYARQSAGCDNSLGAVVFRFSNPYDIYLHDTPEQQLFNWVERNFSHGCIRVEKAAALGTLLLKNDDATNLTTVFIKALAAYQTKTFRLKTPVPLSIVYITCDVNDWGLVTYKDIYNLDRSLEMALYNVSEPLSLR